MDPAGHQQPTSPAGGAAGYYPPPPGAAAAAPATGYYPPPPQAAAAPTAQPAADGQPAARPHYAAAAGAGTVPAAAPAAAAHAPATAVAPGVGSKRPYEESSAAAAAGGYSHAAADGAVKRQQLGAAAAAPAAAAPAPAAAAPVTSGRPSAASIPRETIYRLVLDVVDTALIIGRGGNTVRSIEQATGAAVGGCCWKQHLKPHPPVTLTPALPNDVPLSLNITTYDVAPRAHSCCCHVRPPPTAGGRIKRLQEPPGAREQTLVIWSNSRELPAPNRMGRNTAQVRWQAPLLRKGRKPCAKLGVASACYSAVSRTRSPCFVLESLPAARLLQAHQPASPTTAPTWFPAAGGAA